VPASRMPENPAQHGSSYVLCLVRDSVYRSGIELCWRNPTKCNVSRSVASGPYMYLLDRVRSLLCPTFQLESREADVS
jgi:hypothetical protein